MDQVRIGIVGVTGRGVMAVPHLHDPEGKSVITAGMDVSTEALEHFKTTIDGKVFVTTEIDELVARDDIDAVMVSSPDFTHEEYVIKALNAGKHVFTEKPMAITTEGCDRMMEAWKNSGKHFMVGFNMRYMNIFRVMKDIADSGEIGEIKAVWVRHFVGYGGDWYYHDWHGTRRDATSLLLQKASHDFDMIHWITGRYSRRAAAFGALSYYGGDKPNDLRCSNCDERDTCVEFNELKPDSSRSNKMDMCVFREEIDVEDTSSVIMELEGNIQAVYTQCHYTPDYFRNYTFIGTEGRMENLDDRSKVMVKLRRRSNRWSNLTESREHAVRKATGSHGGADPVICRDFLDMLLSGKRPIATPLAGRMSVAVGCAAAQSMRNGGMPVDLPPLPDSISDFVY